MITVLLVFGAAASVQSGSGAVAADNASFRNGAAATDMNVCDVTVAVVNDTAALGCTYCAKLGGCSLTNFGRRDSSVLGLSIAHHTGLCVIANGNIGFGGCPCSDGVLGLVGTPSASLDGAADVRLGLSGAHLVPALIIQPAVTSALAAVLWLAMREGV